MAGEDSNNPLRMAEQFTIPTPGDTVAGKYLIKEELGRGSHGVVFRARQLGLTRDVALKTLLPKAFLQSDIVTRFQREASLISRLQHPNIVTLYDFGEMGGVLYMAMEFVRGRPLSKVMREEAPLEEERAAHIIKQVLNALSVAHNEGIVHRDLKPENILLTQNEDGVEVVKVLDFGIAKLTRGEESQDALKALTIEGYVLGTPHYMSPESISGDPVTNRADLYAVGILLYELLTGEHPFQAPNPSAVMIRHLRDPVPPLPDSDQDNGRFGFAIRKALEKEPDDRIADAATMIQILDGEISPPKRRGRWVPPAIVSVVGIGLLVLGIAAAAWFLREQNRGELSQPGASQPTAPAGDTGRPDDSPAPDTPSMTRSAAVVATSAAQVDTARKSALRASNQSAKNKGRATAGAKPKRSDATTARLRLVSRPAGAQVTVNGRAVGTAPCTHNVPTLRAARVSFRKIGFKPVTVTVTPKGGSQTVSVTLQPGRMKLAP